jgi:hypothetical protein
MEAWRLLRRVLYAPNTFKAKCIMPSGSSISKSVNQNPKKKPFQFGIAAVRAIIAAAGGGKSSFTGVLKKVMAQ